MTRLRALSVAALACAVAPFAAQSPAPTTDTYVVPNAGPGRFPLSADGRSAPLHVSSADHPGVVRAARDLRADIGRASPAEPTVSIDTLPNARQVVIIGTIGKSPVIDRLVRAGKLDTRNLAGRWETFVVQIVSKPQPGIDQALVIAGSDKRGTIYGIYDVSDQIGVSPWHYWADVPVRKQPALYVLPGRHTDGEPAVKYRGIFINDEAPALSGWTREKFGGFNSKFYEKVFELVLRMKGNYLWPAMWGNAFADDDTLSPRIADEYGVVMGTSHHEPLTRAQAEWRKYGKGEWNYETNDSVLREFWRGGIRRMGTRENIVTVGMRGDGDEPMTRGTAIALLERIVADQRKIIAEETKKDPSQTPQLWALYKEVQDYYDRGMQVPDDVILLFADDNWGQIRRLPAPGAQRPGGYGVYYHFDYVGGPRNYKWLNTVQIEKTWQQMDLAWARGARSLWIVNVGDLKPMEFPLSFFMKQAWNPQAMTLAALAQYPQEWARATFGPAQASAIAKLVSRYSQLAAMRKPELVDADSFRLNEFGAIVAEWQSLQQDMLRVRSLLRPEQRAAYFQLVEHPITALANLYELYYAVAQNRSLAALGDARANVFADQAEAAFRRDQEIANAYHSLNDGKWSGMMAQTHIGYVGWQQPERQTMPQVQRVATPSAAVTLPVAKGDATGAIAIEAPDYSRAVDAKGLAWRIIPNLGRALGAVTAFPQGRAPTTQQDGVRLEYDVSLSKAGALTVYLHMVPTLDVSGAAALHVGVSVDDRPMQTLTDRLIPAAGEDSSQAAKDWSAAVQDNLRVLQASFADIEPGEHVIKVWRLDDNVVLQKIVAGTDAVPP